MQHSAIPRCIHTPNLGCLPQIIWEIWPGHKSITDGQTEGIKQTYSPPNQSNRSKKGRGLLTVTFKCTNKLSTRINCQKQDTFLLKITLLIGLGSRNFFCKLLRMFKWLGETNILLRITQNVNWPGEKQILRMFTGETQFLLKIT